jgi:hypothetical protein
MSAVPINVSGHQSRSGKPKSMMKPANTAIPSATGKLATRTKECLEFIDCQA